MSTEAPATATPISQADAASLFLPAIKARGKRYAKFKEVLGRPAVPGEVIVTRTADGVETSNTAKYGDYVVRNETAAAEEYIVPAAKFPNLYEYLPGLYDEVERAEGEGSGYLRYKAKGEVDGVMFTAADFGTWNPLTFIAPWGSPMVAKDGDMIVSPDGKEVYRIAATEFAETYRVKGD
jgi:hypothetical protein